MPFVPLIVFILAIEPFAIAVRCHKNIIGLSVNKQEHRIALLADDVILYPSLVGFIMHIWKAIRI